MGYLGEICFPPQVCTLYATFAHPGCAAGRWMSSQARLGSNWLVSVMSWLGLPRKITELGT